jgi:GNAT superfamily N-acetyltransferase
MTGPRGSVHGALLALFDAHRGADATADGAPFEHDGPVTRIRFAASGFVAAPADTGLRGAELDALIARQRDHFAAIGMSVEWKTYAHDEPADLPDRLIAAGFAPDERETLVVGEASALSGLAAEVPGVTIRETSSDEDLAAIGRLHTEVWEDDWGWIVDDLRDRARRLGPDGIRILVAEAEGRVVSAAWLVMRPGTPFAGLWGGSTLVSHRGRGIYRALVSRRAAIARTAGYRYLQVDASDMSRPILERLGFQIVTTTTPYVWRPALTAE